MRISIPLIPGMILRDSFPYNLTIPLNKAII